MRSVGVTLCWILMTPKETCRYDIPTSRDTIKQIDKRGLKPARLSPLVLHFCQFQLFAYLLLHLGLKLDGVTLLLVVMRMRSIPSKMLLLHFHDDWSLLKSSWFSTLFSSLKKRYWPRFQSVSSMYRNLWPLLHFLLVQTPHNKEDEALDRPNEGFFFRNMLNNGVMPAGSCWDT